MPTIKTSAAIVAAVLCFGSPLGAAPLPLDQLPAVDHLISPFVFTDGSKVKSAADWDRRREQLKQLFEDYEYGTLPPAPEKLEIRPGVIAIDEIQGVSIQDFVLHMTHQGRELDLFMRLHLPLEYPNGRLPVFIQSGDGGGPPPPPSRFQRPEPTEPNVYTTHGYAAAYFRFNAMAADNPETYRESGIYALFGDDIDTGGLMAWAWGMHRVVDALVTLDRIDASRIAVTGHSRNGKAALVAGAFDERIALTVPSHSGCSGSAPYRFIYGNSEQLHNIAGFAPQWFRPDFSRFVDHVNQLPVDQHLLKALVAPRALMSTEGSNDAWTNPEGSQLTYLAAKEVYEFLGADDRISIKTRPVGHVPSNEDNVAYADHVFFGKPLPAGFGELEYSVEMAGYDWSAPE